MSILLIVIAGLVVGAVIPSRWMLTAPIAIGAAALIGMAANGHGIADTPVPFLIVGATLAIGSGRFVRRRSPQAPLR